MPVPGPQPASSRDAPSPALIVGILVLASSTSIMSTDMYSPSLPDLVGYFDTSPTLVQLTISLNMLAFGLAQLVHGPLSDRFGRRPVLLFSLAAVVLLSLACAAAQTIGQLIAARVLLGLAAAAEAVIGLAVIKDLYDERGQVRALALLNMAIAIAPAVAPILGGYLHVGFGWQSNFVVVALMALLAFVAIARRLPESTTPDPGALAPRRVLGRYLALLGNADFMVHSLICGVALGLIFVFVTGAPFVLIERLGVAPQHFGYYQATIVLAFFVGSVAASRVADLWPGTRLLNTGIAIIVAGAMTLTLAIATGALGAVTLTLAFSIMTLGMGPVFAVGPSRALRSIDAQAGTASALLSGIEQSAAGLSAVAISLLHDGSDRPMAVVTGALTILLLVLVWASRRGAAALSPRDVPPAGRPGAP